MKKLGIVIGTSLLIALSFVVLIKVIDGDDGKAYDSQQALCTHIGQSWLQTIKKSQKEMADDELSRVIAVGSDLYDLCITQFDEKSLLKYETKNIQRYLEKGK
jgi:hypothetical protein